MEKVARRIDAPLIPERGLTTSSLLDADLRERIRSLLISRNRQYPPRTPYTTPDYNQQTWDPDENRPESPLLLSQPYRFSPARAIFELSQLTSEPSNMGATRFDGPGGQVDDDDAGTSPRRPSQPKRQNDRNSAMVGPRSRVTSGLNQRSHADVLGREASSVDSLRRSNSSASKTSNGTSLPRFHLRTVPPAVDVNKAMRPTPLRVPRSNRSGIPSKQQQASKSISPPSEDKFDTTCKDPLAIPTYAGLGDGNTHKAIDALTQVGEHDRLVSDRSKIILHKTPSQSKLRSTSPAKQSPNMQLEPRASEAIVNQAAQSVLTPSTSHGHLPENLSERPVSIAGIDNEERVVEAPLAVIEGDSLDSFSHRETESDPLGGPKISALLAQLPPVRKSTVEDVSAYTLTVKPFAVSEKASAETCSPSVSSLESVPLNTDGGILNQESPLLPKSSQINRPVEADQEEKIDTDAETSAAAELRNSSPKIPKLSTASRAMSMLSEMSARTGLQAPSLSSITRRGKKSSAANSNLTTRPHRNLKRAPADISMLSAGKGYKPLGDDFEDGIREGTDSTDRFQTLRNQQKNGAGFTKIIQDLESLLHQALTIASQTTDKEDGENTPLNPHSTESVNSSQALSSLSGAGDEEDNYSSIPPQQATIKEPKSDALYQGHFQKTRDTTPYPEHTRQASTIPDIEFDDGTNMKQKGTNRLLDIPSASKADGQAEKPSRESSFTASDWAVIRAPSHTSHLRLEMKPPPRAPQMPPNVQPSAKEQHSLLLRTHGASESTLSREIVRDYVNAHHQPPVQPRLSSKPLKKGRVPHREELNLPEPDIFDGEDDCEHVPYIADFETAGLNYHPVIKEAMAGDGFYAARPGSRGFQPPQDTAASLRDVGDNKRTSHRRERSAKKDYSLNDRHHLTIHEPHFSLSRSHRRSPIARDWRTSRKRYVASVTCITTAFMGMIIGIYAGEVPAIQYAIADEHHYTILGNVLFFLGLALTTALFYPLPLLHGRKPYTLAALAILLPLQFPQALAINSQRSPNVATYRVGLLLPRIVAGIVMGFANINFITTMLDLFGASLQSGNPHQETVNVNDVRRHGGGMGVWLGIWTWCAIGSIGTGFLIGAGIISGLDVSWGFWITIIVNAAVLVLNILTPEVRRSAYRRSMAEVRSGGEVSRRVARGEIKMHLESTGPIWWWEEVIAGHVLAIRMLLQPGFAILSLYLGWIYGQVVLVIVVSFSRLHDGYRAYES